MPTPNSTPAWARALLGEHAVCSRIIGEGTSRTTIVLEVPPQPDHFVARHDTGAGPLSGTPFTLAREAATYQAVAGAGIPVPAVVAVAADGRAFAVEEVAGTTDGRGDALDDYLRLLGVLHRTGLTHAPHGHDGFDAAGSEDLAIWERIAAERIVRDAPIVAFALASLHERDAHRPNDVVLCHGDAGFGNYLQTAGRVTGLVDWEMAHTGDPHDDLASVAVRAALSKCALTDYRARLAAHWEPASGRSFDPDRYGVAVVAVLTRMVISCLVALDNTGADTDRTTQLMGLPLMEVQLLRAIAALDGVHLGAPASVSPHPAFVRELAEVVVDGLPECDQTPHANANVDTSTGTNAGAARRRGYLADQLVAVLRSAEDDDVARGAASAPAADAGALWQTAHDRLAALPASRRLADAPIAGTAITVTPC